MLLIHARFHIDSEVEINAATENAYKAVLFKKKGFEPALMPPRYSIVKDSNADLTVGN
jgi:hypothetical protein